MAILRDDEMLCAAVFRRLHKVGKILVLVSFTGAESQEHARAINADAGFHGDRLFCGLSCLSENFARKIRISHEGGPMSFPETRSEGQPAFKLIHHNPSLLQF